MGPEAISSRFIEQDYKPQAMISSTSKSVPGGITRNKITLYFAGFLEEMGYRPLESPHGDRLSSQQGAELYLVLNPRVGV